MKLLFVVDGRSPIALNWIRYFVAAGDEVHLVSMYPCEPVLPLASLTVLPVAFSQAAPGAASRGGDGRLKAALLRRFATPRARTWLRHYFVPRSLPRAAGVLRALIAKIRPDLVHAMRVPYEGMLAALACSDWAAPGPPLLVSIWGNDFTLHAPATRALTSLTRLTMQRADALHTDCYRDQNLAREWGFAAGKPAVVLPGGGGIQPEIFRPPESPPAADGVPRVINPRGMRAYVRNDTFFRAIPRVLAAHPKTRFVCPNMAGQAEAQRWVRKLHLGAAVELLPRQSRAQMAAHFRQAQVVVSPSTHDGTPNTLLEAMACGCFPVVGDIAPLREWITQGENGFLVDPADPRELADAVCEGLQNPELRARACNRNRSLIRARAEYPQVMAAATDFYRRLILR